MVRCIATAVAGFHRRLTRLAPWGAGDPQELSKRPSSVPALVSDNNGRITTDGLVFTATDYMQTCPDGFFISQWQLQRESGQVGIVYGCCHFR